MRKRAVSPVIATVLLIALVTAAAAIVFLVVMPMLKPSPDANITVHPGSIPGTGSNRKIQVDIEAKNGNLNITGVTAVPTSGGSELTNLDVQDAQGNSLLNTIINQDTSKTVYIVGPFSEGTQYTITLHFTSGGSTVDKTFTVTA